MIVLDMGVYVIMWYVFVSLAVGGGIAFLALLYLLGSGRLDKYIDERYRSGK